ncbi:gliding motility-associated C-terminal domain-containing protein [Microvirga sp. STS02]|uniref:DUF7948 domain-containing protein n=1 Tax=Hymenobacter negativus TaxID=2795026 RepID=UPI0018DCEDC2|nr:MULTISPECIES: gliding motility-associated C-terminal domain-containing protein [Bacteria]MBH8570228.1 gliding motility-associated C-terminal domain-containing protein [Hymenobacter negativus]MBR7209967.1 gliding motility-associated C-terminal domain-containing protein [Microvirga sp. STS02]
MKQLLLLGLGLLLGLSGFAQTNGYDEHTTSTLEFIENKGQWDAHARYAAALPGGRLFAEADGLTLALLADDARVHHGRHAPGDQPPASQAVRGHALTLHFENAAPALLTAETPTTEHRSYFLGADSKHWAADVRSYRELRYAGLWPGIGARVYESADQHLEYDFTLAPGANPAAIGLRHDGADGLTLDGEGNLLVKTSIGNLTERAPQAWQTDAAGRRQAVACRYVLAGRAVHFALGRYDTSRSLTIDPIVVFATYTGSTADNWGFTATYDAQGNLYSGGITFGAGYPASPGAFQTTFAGLIDIAIIKYSTGVSGPAARVWATYIGGSGADFPHSLVVNNQGELLVLGSTGSGNYPTTAGAIQRTFGGGTAAQPFGSFGPPYDLPTGSDLVVTRLNANATALVGSTYLGGSGNDGVLPLNPNLSPFMTQKQLVHNYGDPFRGDILVDTADNVYIASHTASTDFPVARGLTGGYHGGTSDGVVCKLAPNLTALTWASYLGGTGADAAYSVQLEPTSGDVYVAGGTTSTNFPATAGAFRTTAFGDVDGFAVRIAAAGTSVLRATYVGTTDYDQAYFLQVGTDGGVYLLGQTLGQFPTTPGLFHTANGTQFIQKLDANLNQSLLTTSFGSLDPDNVGRVSLDPTAFLVDRCDRVYVCGWGGMVNGRYLPDFPAASPYQEGNGSTTRLPLTSDALQSNTDGNDFYLAQFSAGLTSLSYGTYYGNVDPNAEGEHVDGGTSRFDPRGIVYQSVCSCFSYTGFPIPPEANTYSTTNNSGTTGGAAGCNNAAFVLNFQPNIANAGPAQALCVTSGPVPLVGTPAGGTFTGPGVSGSVATGFIFTPTLALVGVNTVTYTVPGTGLCTSTGTRRITVLAPLTAGADTVLCAGSTQPIRLSGTPAGGIFSGPGVTGSVAAGFNFTLPAGFTGTATLTYTVASTTCSGARTATRRISVAPVPLVQAGWEPVACPENRLAPLTLRFTLASSSNSSTPAVVWEFGDGTQSTELSPTHTYTNPGSYQPRLRLRYNLDRCETTATTPPVEVKERKVPNIITPNGDGKNQTLQLGPGCAPRLQIFSRWGQKVFEAAAYHDEWNADGQPDGVYYYLITYPDGQQLKGWVEVRR